MKYHRYQLASCVDETVTLRLRGILSAAYPECPCCAGGDSLRIVQALADDADARIVDASPGSFAITVEDPMVHIVGRDRLGLRYAVDALEEKLGAGHYLAFDTPPPRRDAIDPSDWALRDEPLMRRRILFNWHNFISGCSGWNEPDWRGWIDQGRKLRFNAVMVHCYSNSPMLEADINGVERPVGWLSTSVKGRDWGTQHANDVRRIPGARPADGPPLFDQAAFGSEAGLVPDAERAAAMKSMMGRVFDHALSNDLDVYLAVDVDCQTDHPAVVLDTLPAEAKIGVRTPAGVKAFVHPEHPEGVAVYRQLIERLLSDFPQVTHLVAWFRGKRSDWGLLSHLAPEDLPADWREEYRRQEPEFSDAMRLNTTARPPYLFALAKIIRTLRRALRDVGREDVELLCGSWDMEYLASFHYFVDRSVPLIVLDYDIRFHNHDFHQAVSKVSGEREIIPVLWAHHDDHSYIGRSYAPVPRLHTRLRGMGVDSVGVIHWTTRPLDLYFKNTCRQLWSASRNEALETTVRRMAEDLFGEDNAARLADYLYLWITTSAFFGVETNQRFMSDRFKPFEDPVQQILLARNRLEMLESLPEPDAVDQRARTWLEFYRDAERFLIAFHECVDAMLRCADAPVAEARSLLKRRDPRRALRAYADHIRHGETTRGEKGVLYSMATRWWVFYEELRQIYGLAPVRLAFGPTRHDPLATLPGVYTWFFEADSTPWMQKGEHETGAAIVEILGGVELGAHGVDLSDGLDLPLASWFGRELRIAVGEVLMHLSGADTPVRLEWLDSEDHILSRVRVAGCGEKTVSAPRGADRLRLRAEGACLTHAVLRPRNAAGGGGSFAASGR